MKKYTFNIIIPALVIVIFVVPRLYRLNTPLADWHSWRQADTAAVARNFVKGDFNLLYPQSDSFLALNEYNLENPNRYFINEFPAYNAIVAVVYKQYGINHVYARIISIIFSTFGALFLYLLTKKLLGIKIALTASLYYALNSYSIFYSRVVMPDPIFVSLSIISLYWCLKWVDSKKLLHGFLLMVTFSLAMLVKPYAIFMAIPMVYWVLINQKLSALKKPLNYLIVIGSFLPLILWRLHRNNHLEGTFASTWLLNGGDIRFKGAFFRWIIFDRFNRLIFATGGFVLFVLGVIKSHISKKRSLIFVWLLSVLLYIIIFAKGNVNHDYYQLPIMPVGAILVAIGFWEIIKSAKTILQKSINTLIAISLVLLSLAFGWYEVRGFFNINNPAIVAAGRKVDEITPKDAYVIANYQGDPAFLYQTNRYGWPIGGDIEALIEKGASYYVTTTKDDEFQRVKSNYQLVYEEDDFAIVHLVKEDLEP